MEKKVTVQKMCLIGLMAAMVYVSSAFLQIPIPTAIGNTRLHMGNVMCLLSGLLLGPMGGGLAAGIGSMFFDLTNPLFISSAPFTFVFKFLMAWLCGKIYMAFGHQKNPLWISINAAAAGNLLYIVLYLGKSFFEAAVFLQQPMAGVLLSVAQKGTVSLMNGVTAVIAAVPLSLAIRPALGKIMMKTIG